VEFVDEAVWVENTTLAFHVDDDQENADHGSRCVCVRVCVRRCCARILACLPALPPNSPSTTAVPSLFGDHAMVHEDGIREEIPALNFSDFLARNFRAEDTVIVRCDIEGAEYA